MASRMAAKSTTAGTPVKSCNTTREGVNAISVDGSALGSQLQMASMSETVTSTPFSLRSKFSNKIFKLKGNRLMSCVSAILAKLKYL